MNRSPLPEGGHIKKGISALWNRKMARLCAKWSATTVWLVNTKARQLTELYRALRLYVNCFQPSMKLLSKERDGKKIRCVYDPAKTPLQRLLLSVILSAQKQQELTEVAEILDPISLLNQLKQLQQVVFRCAVSSSPEISPILSAAIRVFSVDECKAGKHPEERSVPDLCSRAPELVSRAGAEKTGAGLAAHPQGSL
jgi:hypothetical protein